jgi:hypothetical protein
MCIAERLPGPVIDSSSSLFSGFPIASGETLFSLYFPYIRRFPCPSPLSFGP